MRNCLFFFLFGVASLFSHPLDVEVSAKSAILLNAETGEVVFAKHPHLPSYPASITKVATALFVLDEKKPQVEEMITVSKEAVRIRPVSKNYEGPAYLGEVDGTTMGLLQGEVLSFDSLLHGMLLVSGNDAANALAESLAPSIPSFVEEMNQYLVGLGCENTFFRNPHGLHHQEHVTTAYDMAKITQKALQVPKFRSLLSTVSYRLHKTNKRGAKEIEGYNRLLKKGPYYYPHAIGGKTGYHSKALYTLVAAAEKGGRTLIAVVLGCPTKTSRYADVIRLFETAFSEREKRRLLFAKGHVFSRDIEGAKIPLQSVLGNDILYVTYPSEERKVQARVEWGHLSLPIEKGSIVGTLIVETDSGRVVHKEQLLAKETVQATWLETLRRWVFSI